MVEEGMLSLAVCACALTLGIIALLSMKQFRVQFELIAYPRRENVRNVEKSKKSWWLEYDDAQELGESHRVTFVRWTSTGLGSLWAGQNSEYPGLLYWISGRHLRRRAERLRK